MTTAAKSEPPHHNNLTCYTNYSCRLPDCVERYRHWNRTRTNAKRAGQWQPHVDAEPVRQHVRVLAAHDISLRQIATLTGFGHQTIHALFRRPVRHAVRPELAAAILAIDPTKVTPGKVDPTGTGRRIQALVANGWTMSHLAEHLGVYRSYVHALTQRSATGQLILASTAQKVADGYEVLEHAKPRAHGVSPRLIKQSRNMAASRCWPPTSYWADRMDVIDDPHFIPEYKKLRAQVIAEETHWLMTQGGLDRDQAAARLGIARFTVDRALREHPQDDPGLAA